MISALKIELLDIVWPSVEEHIAMACDKSNGEVSSEEIKDMAKKGHVLILTISEETNIVATVILETKQFLNGKKVLRVSAAGGTRMPEWVNQLDAALNDIAREQKCDEIYITGREGWVKALKKLNYDRIYTTLSREVI